MAMRRGIFKDDGDVRRFDIAKIVGKGFGNGWFTNCHCRYRVFKGARNTGKSKRLIGYETLFKIMSDPRRNIIVCRQDDVNNRQSTYANIMRCIGDLGLEQFFTSKSQPLEITYNPTGQKIIFRGLNNPTSLTSVEFSTGYLTDIYIEEAYEVPSFDNFEMLDGSIRAGVDYDDEGNIVKNDIPLQITLLLNPWTENWIYENFFHGRLEDDYEYLESHKYKDMKDEEFQGNHGRGLYLHSSTYKCNEFRDRETVDKAAEEMKQKNPDLYKVVYLGMWGATGAITYPEFSEANLKDSGYLATARLISYTLGIDAGFSNGEGKKRTVKKGEDPVTRVRSATTMTLTGFTVGYNEVISFDEFYHTNIQTRNSVNTHSKEELTMPEIAGLIIMTIKEWKERYKNVPVLMKGHMQCFVDNADIGFIQMLRMKAREYQEYNLEFIPSTKSPIHGRVLFEKALLAYHAWLIDRDRCKNLIREIKNARGDDKGNIRSDEDDHMITAHEYSSNPYRNNFVLWKNNFKDQ